MSIEVFEKIAGLVGLPAALFAFILYLGHKGVWHWDSEVRDLKRQLAKVEDERDRWQMLAFQGTKLAGEGLEVAKSKPK
jgi:hypothetical protein